MRIQGCRRTMVSNNNTQRVYALAPVAGMAVAMATLAACGGGSSAADVPPPVVQSLSAAAVAGEALFHDKSLSASGQQSCATCHVKSRAFTADPAVDKGLPVPLGGRNMDEPGFRNAPSLMYAAFTPAFSINDGTPSGGVLSRWTRLQSCGAGSATLPDAVRNVSTPAKCRTPRQRTLVAMPQRSTHRRSTISWRSCAR